MALQKRYMFEPSHLETTVFISLCSSIYPRTVTIHMYCNQFSPAYFYSHEASANFTPVLSLTMTESTRIDDPTVQAAKAAENTVLAILKDIKATERRSDALNGLSHRLSAVGKALQCFVLGFDQSCSYTLSLEVQHHLRLAFRGSQEACIRSWSLIEERTSHISGDPLHGSEWDGFGAFRDVELQLLSERLEVLEKTIGTVMEISALYVKFDSLILGSTCSLRLCQAHCFLYLDYHL